MKRARVCSWCSSSEVMKLINRNSYRCCGFWYCNYLDVRRFNLEYTENCPKEEKIVQYSSPVQ